VDVESDDAATASGDASAVGAAGRPAAHAASTNARSGRPLTT
jgi:hypothetical protein